jgi:hypothetical protein
LSQRPGRKRAPTKSALARAHNKSGASAASDQSKRVKIIKKPRGPEIIEAEIAELEKRIGDLSVEMTKPEVARDITRLVQVNNEYERAQARLAELYEEWERAETATHSR